MMAKKANRHGLKELMAAVSDLSHLAMATTTTKTVTLSFIGSSTSKWSNDSLNTDRFNWLLHIMYGRGEYDRIQQFINIQPYKSAYMLYVQALTYRQEGRIMEALDNFQQCAAQNPSLTNIKQVAKSLVLLGRYRLAIDAYKDALANAPNDWEIAHQLGLCLMNLNDLQQAKLFFRQAIQISALQEASYLALGKICLLTGERTEAESVYQQGVNRNPESPELFTQLGLMAFQRTDYKKAFECFGTALTFSPTHIPAIMAACQVIQKHGDADVALSKYRIIYGRKPECAQVWNNIGMCFFSKRKFVAAVSCLKRANYLAPFELYVVYNLALVHMHLQQVASAAVFLQTAIRLDKKHAPSYALLGVALSKLNDPDNAFKAFTYSLKLDPSDPMTLLNLAILQTNTHCNQNQIDATLQLFHRHYSERTTSGSADGEIDSSMLDIANKLTGTSATYTVNEDTQRQSSSLVIVSTEESMEKDSLNSF